MYKKSKKYLCVGFIFIMLFFVHGMFAQNFHMISDVENLRIINNPSSYHNSAMQLLQNAKNLMLMGKYEEAYTQAQTALVYDPSIADLYYIQALSLIERTENPAESIALLETALSENGGIWYEYNQDSARIILAKLYIQTKKNEEALALLAGGTPIFNAETFLLRAKAYYNLNESEKARAFLYEGSMQYPENAEFPLLFFKYEYFTGIQPIFEENNTEDFLNESNFFAGDNAENPEIRNDVDYLADFFMARIHQFSQTNPDILLFAAAFKNDENEKNLLLREWNALGKTHPLYAVHALQNHAIDENAAVDYMIPFFESIDYSILTAFVSLLEDAEAKKKLHDYFADYNGAIYFDLNKDFVPEMTVLYERGRPSYIEYDENQDGILSWYMNCDYGEPINIHLIEENIVAKYDAWPFFSSVTDNKKSENNIIYSLVANSIEWTPVYFIKEPAFELSGQHDLYIPVLNQNGISFPDDDFFAASYAIDIAIDEYPGSRIYYTLLHGIVKNAVYRNNGTPYAYGQFENGILIYRNVDKDNDGKYELIEVYNYNIPQSYNFLNDEEKQILSDTIFGFDALANGHYIKHILVDTDNDGIANFTQQYENDGATGVRWDTDNDGNWDIQFIQNADKSKQELHYLHPTANETVVIFTENGIPVNANGKPIVKDVDADFYWIGEYPGASYAEKIITELNLMGNAPILLTVSDLLKIENEDRFMRIVGVKNGDMYFGEVFYE
ncbi:MAG: hypothetical protein R3Y36_05165 [Spirochaetales bacterium]